MERKLLLITCLFIFKTAFSNTAFGYKEYTYIAADQKNNSHDFNLTAAEIEKLTDKNASDTYTVSFSSLPAEGGSLSGSGTYNYGNNVTVNATPRQGYSFANWTENGTLVSTSSTYSFIINSNRALTANFKATTYLISAVASPSDGGTLSGGGTYNYGTNIFLNATPAAGYSFLYWSENGAQISENSFYNLTVKANRTLVANFGKITYFGSISATAVPAAGGNVSGGGTYAYGSVATIDATPNNGYNFSSWSVNGTIVSTNPAYSFTVDGNRMLTANFTIRTHSVYVTASPAGGGSASGGGTYNYGSVVNLNATPNAGYNFVSWTENGSQVSTSSFFSFTVNSNRTIVANFSNNTTYTVLASANPPAGGNVSGNGVYNIGSLVTMNAIPGAGYSFINWTENGTQVSTSSAYTFTINSNRTLVASFTPVAYSILASASPLSGGMVSGNGSYNYGSTAALTAAPLSGYIFTNWTEGGTVVSTSPTYNFTVSGNRTLTANFKISTFTISVPALPAGGGSVSGSGTYNYGSSVTLTANPGNGYSFVNWTENGTQLSTEATLSFTGYSNRTITANFKTNLNSYSIVASAVPSESGTASGGKIYTDGSIAILTASPAAGYSFTNWTENGTIVSTNSTYSFTVVGSRSLIANFILNMHTITVSSSPEEGGSASGSGTYNYGSAVTLSAIPVKGYSFESWTENGIQASTSSTYTFTLNSNRSLIANFSLTVYNIQASTIPITGGAVSGSNAYTYGSLATLMATSNTGYSFTGWTEGGTLVSSDSSYNFIVTQNRTLLANFIIRTQTISVTASPSEGGSVSSGGTYNYGSVITLYTIPKMGYNFLNWTENGLQVSTSSTYSFTVNADRNLVANYTPVTYLVSASASPAAGGAVSGGKIYDYGSMAILTAKVSTGYSFNNWTEDGTIVSTDSIYSFTVEGRRSLIANFKIKTYTISASVNPAESGAVSGGGAYNYGSNITLNATPGIGYNFVNWTENGIQVSISSTYSFLIDADRTFVANFSHNTNNSGIILASVSPATGGKVSGSKSYDLGSIATVKAIANTGYSFSSWTEGGTIVSTDSIYSFTVERNRNLIAVFIINTYNISITASAADGGFFNGGVTYNLGSTAFLNATPYIGYRFVNWTENGVNVSTNSAYSFTVESNRTLVANFILLVGLQENISQEIRMYPNPAHDVLYFEFPSTEQQEIRIFNNSGQLVLTAFEKTINISDLPVGFYIVKVKEKAFKLIKQ